MINNVLDPLIIELLKEIDSLGFKLCLVGGATRDYFLKNSLGNDYDFELRSHSQNKDTWADDFLRFVDFIKTKNLKYEIFPYQIIRVELSQYSLEFSSPRIEYFIGNSYNHHNFVATLDPSLAYEDSFRRRDFTINAIGVEFNFSNHQITEKIYDPYNGLNDIKNKILGNIDDDFYKDSVRFLRLIRFSIKLNFSVSEQIIKNISKFNLTQLSKFHFSSELFKCDAATFLNRFSSAITENNLVLSEEFHVWLRNSWPVGKIFSREDILGWCVLNKNELVTDIQNFFSFSQKTAEKMKSYFHSLIFVSSFGKDNFLNLLDMPIEVALSQEVLKHLKNIDDKNNLSKLNHLLDTDQVRIIFSDEDFNSIKVSSSELKEIEPEYRSYFKYFMVVKRKYER